jgi:hypothetical protein
VHDDTGRLVDKQQATLIVQDPLSAERGKQPLEQNYALALPPRFFTAPRTKTRPLRDPGMPP